MTYAAVPVSGYTTVGRRRPARTASFRPFGPFALLLGVLAGASILGAGSTALPGADETPRLPPVVAAGPTTYVALLDAGYSLGSKPESLARSAPLAADFRWAEPQAPLEPAPSELVEAVSTPLPPSLPVTPQPEDSVPLPMPRPPELVAEAGQGSHRLGRSGGQRSVTVVAQTAPTDTRSFLQRFFGMGQPSGPVLAYAAPENGVVSDAPSVLSGSLLPSDRYTAVYNIAAHTVTLPDGTRLEAHSGLGPMLDNPRHVNAKNRGPTPPHVYDLTPRGQLFHGVQALRLNPVGGGSVYGRNGLLAHTYMLGPNGDSNGCVSFRDYKAFLQAFMNGQVKHLVVVAGLM